MRLVLCHVPGSVGAGDGYAGEEKMTGVRVPPKTRAPVQWVSSVYSIA